MSADISSSNDCVVTLHTKANKETMMSLAAGRNNIYGGGANSAATRWDLLDGRTQQFLAQIPPSERPDITLMQHLIKQDMEFSMNLKKRPPARETPYAHIVPREGPKPQQQQMNFKRLLPVTSSSSSMQYDGPKSAGFVLSIPDALDALKIPSPADSPMYDPNDPEQIPKRKKILFPPDYSNHSAMSQVLLTSSAAAAASTKKRRSKNNHHLQPELSENPAPKRKKLSTGKPGRKSLSSGNHASSEPPASGTTTTTLSKEKSGTPTLNEDVTVRRSGRKVIKPAHLAVDIGVNEKVFYREKLTAYDSTSATVAAAAGTAAASGNDKDDETKNYDECAALLPDLIEGLEISAAKVEEEKDLDELTFIPKDIESLHDEELKKYLLVCQIKMKCDAHIAFVHLSTNGFDIKKALETFDLQDSLPRKHLMGKDSAGIWSSDELKTFVRLMNNNKCYKRMHKISKHIAEKSTPNVVNAYYALKKDVCSFGREFTLCPEIIKTQKPLLGYEYVDSTKCENCTQKLWEKSSDDQEQQQQYNAEMLCSMCKLYHILYGSLRPNAEATPQIFDDSGLTHEACLYEAMKEELFDEAFIPDWNALKMNVYKVTSTQMKEFIESIKDLKVDQNTQDFITENEKMNENYTYIFFCEKPLTNMPQIYPKNGIPLVECLTLTDPLPTSTTATSTADNDASKEPSSSKSPTAAGGAAITLDSDEENEGPPVLVNELERTNIKKKEVVEKPFEVFYFGYFDDANEFHNENGLEFHHAYLEKIQKYSDRFELSANKKEESEGLLGGYGGSGADKDKSDKELIEKYGNISFAVFSQTFIDSKKKFQAAAEALKVPLEYLEAYVRQNYYNLKVYFAQFERMIKTRARRAKGRNRADEREKRPNYFTWDIIPKKRQNYFLAL